MAAALRFEQLEDRRLLSVTAQEQWFVYLLNRARHDPVAYQQEVNLPVDLSGVPARPPLAVNDALFRSAEFHADEMATFNYFRHQSTVTGDWPNKMVRDQGYPLQSSFPNNANQVESIAAGTFYNSADVVLRELIIDEGVPSLGHRKHLLGIDDFNAGNREIGVGMAVNQAATYTNYWAIHATRSSTSDKFLTGVVFHDANNNGRYNPGEGLSGVTVQVGNQTTTTNAAGGWSLPVAGTGQHTVMASGGGFAGSSSVTVNVGSSSIAVDFISGKSGGYVNFTHVAGSGGGGDSLALFEGSNSAFFFKNTITPGPADGIVNFGPPGSGWKPLTGDWNANGTDSFALYEPTNSAFFIKQSNTPGPADTIVQFGPAGAGWIPLSGDWNGNGFDTVALFDSATSTFYFKNTNGPGSADGIINFGPAGAGWKPLVGDWNGDGIDTFALFEPSNSAFFFKNSNSPGPADGVIQFGPAGAGWTPLAGDWNGNGTDTFGLFEPGNSLLFYKNTNGPGPADGTLQFGPPGANWIPLAGDWNGSTPATTASSQSAIAGAAALGSPGEGAAALSAILSAELPDELYGGIDPQGVPVTRYLASSTAVPRVDAGLPHSSSDDGEALQRKRVEPSHESLIDLALADSDWAELL